jgi:serine/threonine-protein kinase
MALEATPIPGTEGARTPFFSPAGKSVGFWREGRLMKVSVQGGLPTAIADSTFRGASWGPDGTVLFLWYPGGEDEWGLWRVSENGGAAQVTNGHHRWPQILPCGKTALFAAQAMSGRHDESGIAVLSLETGEWRVLLEGGTFARYLPSGHVIYTRYGSLLAVPFDLQRLEVTGESTQVLEDVAMYPMGYAYLAVSVTGALAYVPRRYAPPERSLVWIDRQGKTLPVTEDRRAYRRPSISPDGTRLAVSIARADGEDVWVHDLRQRTWTRLTFEKDNPPRAMVEGWTGAVPPRPGWKADDGRGGADRANLQCRACIAPLRERAPH